MTAKEKKRIRFSLSTNILIGMVPGIGCGIFFGSVYLKKTPLVGCTQRFRMG